MFQLLGKEDIFGYIFMLVDSYFIKFFSGQQCVGGKGVAVGV